MRDSMIGNVVASRCVDGLLRECVHKHLGPTDEHARLGVRVAPRQVLVSWSLIQSLECDFLSIKHADLAR